MTLTRAMSAGVIGVLLAAGSPQVGASPAPFRPGTPKASLMWVQMPAAGAVPGTLLRPDVNGTSGLRASTSFIVKVTDGGRPAARVPVTWRTTDPTAKIVPRASTTDAKGQASIWYLAGSAATATVTAGSRGRLIGSTITRADPNRPTVGRYVALYYSSGRPSESITAAQVQAIPLSAPTRTYYQMMTAWSESDAGEVALYGGVQNFDCSADDGTLSSQICSPERGALRGRMAIFSTWEQRASSGAILKPIAVNQPPGTFCTGFTGEGEGAKCTRALDWLAGVPVSWRVEKLEGASPPYQRVRASYSLAGSSPLTEFVTIDVPTDPDLSFFSSFNENWGGGEARSCLAVAKRSVLMTSVGFTDGTHWWTPISGKAMGMKYTDRSTLCENYAITTTPTGIQVDSGFTGTWVALTPDLAVNSEAFRPIDVSTLGRTKMTNP